LFVRFYLGVAFSMIEVDVQAAVELGRTDDWRHSVYPRIAACRQNCSRITVSVARKAHSIRTVVLDAGASVGITDAVIAAGHESSDMFFFGRWWQKMSPALRAGTVRLMVRGDIAAKTRRWRILVAARAKTVSPEARVEEKLSHARFGCRRRTRAGRNGR
jgi:hypothetical protein